MSKDEWKLLWYGLLTALLMGLFLVPILMHDINFPKLAADAILAIIAGAVFLLYKYMERRKKSTNRQTYEVRKQERKKQVMGVLCESRPLLKTQRGLIVEIAFAGHFGDGFQGNLDANEMKTHVEKVVKNDRPIAVLFNLTNLHYEFGDAIGGAIAVPLLIIEKKSWIQACFVASGKTAQALQPFFNKNMIFSVAGFKMFPDHEQGLASLRERISGQGPD